MKKEEKMLTQDRLKELLDYDEHTGIFTWIVSRGKCKAGSVAGIIHPSGYILIGVCWKKYLAHRLAWAFAFGEFPSKDLDHKDGNRSNNAISNLREATRSENKQNMHIARIGNSTGLLGASYDKQKNKYRAQICVNGKRKYIGLFETAKEAHAAYLSAKRYMHEFCTI